MADIPGTIKDAVVDGARIVTTTSSQGMLNVVLVLTLFGMGMLIYIDRRDRMETMAGQLRFYESQGELNRQSVSNNTGAIQTLTVTVGRLDAAVTALRQEVTRKKNEEQSLFSDGGFAPACVADEDVPLIRTGSARVVNAAAACPDNEYLVKFFRRRPRAELDFHDRWIVWQAVVPVQFAADDGVVAFADVEPDLAAGPCVLCQPRRVPVYSVERFNVDIDRPGPRGRRFATDRQ